MAEKDIELPKDQKAIIKAGKEYSSFMTMVEELSIEPTCEPRCKLCNHELRVQAEDMWDKVKNYAAVWRFLKDKGVDISEPAVKHHLREHYGQDIRNLQLQEYAKDLKDKWINVKQTEEERLNGYLAVIDQQIHQTLAMTDKGNLVDVRKTNECIAKLMDQSSKIHERLQKIHQGTEPARILVEKFKNIVLVQVENISSPEARKALLGILQALENEVEGITLND